jgi:sugar lactone lactonase YvrE
MSEPQTLMTGIAFGESPRWHDDRLWFSDWPRGRRHHRESIVLFGSLSPRPYE